MGARHSRRQKSQTATEQQTEQSQTQHQSSVAAGSGSELVEANVDPTDGQGSANSSLVITICMLKMEPSQDPVGGGEASEEAPSCPQQETDGGPKQPSLPPTATMHPKCGCYENNNCPISLAPTTSTASSSTQPIYGTIGANNNNSATQQTAAKCGCNCSKPDSVNNIETINGNPLPGANVATTASAISTSNDCANNNEVSLISDILSNHHHLVHHHRHHHHHHHHHHIGPWTCPTSSFLAVATTATPSYSGNVICDSTSNVSMSNNASVLNRTMQQHQQQLRQQQQLLASSASSPGPVSPSLMVTASSVCEMSDKLSDLKLNQSPVGSATEAHSSDEHPFSAGECPRCAMASVRQSSTGECEEKILNTTQGSSTKESTKTVTAPSPAATNAASAAGATTVMATTSVSSSSCCRQPLLTTTTTTRTITPSATSTAATLLSSLTSSGKKSRVCKCCRSSNCANQANNNNNISGKGSSSSSPTSSSSTTTGTKSKKGNWGLKFNCAKLRGSKSSQAAAAVAAPSPATNPAAAESSPGLSPSSSSSSTVSLASPSPSIIGSSSRFLKSESEKTDSSCICTLYRKMEDLPATVPSNNGYPQPSNPLVMPHPQLRYHLDGPAANCPGGPMRAAAVSANQQSHRFFFPPVATTGAGEAANHHDLHTHQHPGPGTTTTTIIHRIDGSAAQALWGTASGHPAGNSVIFVDLSRFNSSDDFSLEDCDERARLQRELEIREGVDAPPNFTPRGLMSGGTLTGGTALGALGNVAAGANAAAAANHQIAFVCTPDSSSALSLLQRGLLLPNNLLNPDDMPRVHSQVDFIHCLVPDLQKITSCCFYWGKMDRYEAEKLLDGKPEGTFLLRDSAQEEFLFSVSFRKYNRSLHARIEQFNHKFSFDSRDPGVYTAPTVTGLLEHYKDPSCVMFFEPMLTYPLNRKFVFSLQQLCRATIVSSTSYDGINELCLPKSLKSYLKEYHYRQRVRFRPLDEHLYHNL